MGLANSGTLFLDEIGDMNHEVQAKIQDGTFREDLYYRLNVIEVFLPPLRERIEDISSLAEFFLQRFSQEMKRPKISFSTAALEALLSHSWPGNVRELQNAVEHAVVLGKDAVVQLEDLPARDK